MSVADRPITTDIYGEEIELKPGDNYINHSKGILSWALTLDHKRIGLMYMVVVLASFFLGGIFAIALRTQLLFGKASNIEDGSVIGSAMWNNLYNQAFTLHGAIMVFMFIIPAIPAILGNVVLPLQLGAKDVAFPRLNLMSFYCWMGGGALLGCLLIGAIMHLMMGGENAPAFLSYIPNGLDTGWTFYTPYSIQTNTSVIFATMGAFVLGFSSILTGLNFIATIHMLKPKGMGWFQMPLFLWALYATAVIQILATPVLAITLLLLAAENMLGIGIFDPKLGGDPVLFQHFFWFYSHPAVYIMILPALGVVSEIISVFSRKHIFGYKFIAYSSLAIALFGFIVWGHHMFTSGQSPMINALFSLLTMSVAIPSAIKVFNWLATMWKGRIRLDTPMLYAMGFIWLFTIGGLTGLPLAALSTDIYMHDTYFVVAHFHYVMVGSTLFAFLGGMYYWFPKMFGRMYNEKTGKWAWAVTFIGFNVTFFIQFIAGTQGMPRRYATYLDQYTIYHHISTGGSYILTIGLFMVLANWIMAKRGKRAPANPWGGNQLEWHTNSPPPHENFKYDPVGTDPYHYHDWKYDEKIDGYVLDPDHDPGNPKHKPAH
ncbi:MAG: cbb3-type cytochrome c oxidase subunit I [Phycisphaeraceae bacterium]|nr:cbb3-type cytochrome c oxidase subunit I [Phycisphaeraceae bacterium]